MIELFTFLLGIELLILVIIGFRLYSIADRLKQISESLNDLDNDLVDSLDSISSRIYSLKDN